MEDQYTKNIQEKVSCYPLNFSYIIVTSFIMGVYEALLYCSITMLEKNSFSASVIFSGQMIND